jgi:hypothetical protein
MEDYLECLECGRKRSRFDEFFDLQLVIKDLNSIEEALDKFREPDMLTGVLYQSQKY